MKLKKIVYYILGIIGGIIVSFVVHAIVEMLYINHFLSREILPQPSPTSHLCFLPFYLQVVILLAGIIGGYFFARWGWSVVYEKGER